MLITPHPATVSQGVVQISMKTSAPTGPLLNDNQRLLPLDRGFALSARGGLNRHEWQSSFVRHHNRQRAERAVFETSLTKMPFPSPRFKRYANEYRSTSKAQRLDYLTVARLTIGVYRAVLWRKAC